MSKRLIVVLALALVVGLTFTAYAEVQNVKVSGDILVSGVARQHFNLQSNQPGSKSYLKQSFLMSQVRVRVDADLTDNVMATVRLINERIWNGQNDTDVNNSTTNTVNNGRIDLDLAYVTLKEFLYSPLSLTIGRQEILFGNGLVMGNAKVASNSTFIPTDLTERKAFDAIRATLNYDPLVVDFIYAQVRKTTTIANNDSTSITLAGINATYALNKNNDISAYYFIKKDKYKAGSAGRDSEDADQVSTIGALFSTSAIENLTASLETAYQFGRADSTNAAQKRHNAWAIQAMADYTFAKVKTTPKVGVSYTYLSGSKRTTDPRNDGWDPMFYDQKLNNIVYTLLPFTNMSAFNLKASCKPTEDVTLSAVYGYYNVARNSPGSSINPPNTYNGGTTYGTVTRTGKNHLGDSLDVTAIYDYTEDVQLALTGGVFRPGRGLSIDQKDAQQLIGSMKVVF